jgi:hypothetical protein
LHQLEHGLQVGLKGLAAFVPGLLVGRSGGLWPVAFGEFWRDVFWVTGEFEDVPLREAQVFEELPCGMLGVFWDYALEVDGPIFCDGFEIGVGLASFEEFDEMIWEGFLFWHGWWFSGDREIRCGEHRRRRARR